MKRENTSCILTIIKNEQAYLDEWIKYHLDLGVEHIFIFEDIDSESHKEICDRYGSDKVTLKSVLDIINEHDKNKAIELKKTIKWNVQHIYLRNALLWLKNEFIDKYDWCFFIDNDEFITLEDKSKKLEDILELYKNYDAFTMQWECYGANGHIKKPDYCDKGLIGTYTEKAKGEVPDVIESLIKTCYNLKKYKHEFFFNQHHPSNKCNWCNTDYIKDYIPCYSNIYLRHYITKSWEEYVWKRDNRGFTWPSMRPYDFFFRINIDMMDKKEELINQRMT